MKVPEWIIDRINPNILIVVSGIFFIYVDDWPWYVHLLYILIFVLIVEVGLTIERVRTVRRLRSKLLP